MLVILGSCFGLSALGLISGAVWAYVSQKRKADVNPGMNSQFLSIILGLLGIIACFLTAIIFGIYVWGFSQF
ncbi:MAG: hypothetical protein H7Y59_05915 [Anaerolineales bacterium]|nr:hypothetical protein [Anaerolineales bacterium]